MKRKLFAISLAAVLFLAGCSGANHMASESYTTPGATNGASSGGSWDEGELWSEDVYWDMDQSASTFPMPDEPEYSNMQGSDVYQNPRAKLIRRAELSIQTEQFDQSKEALDKLVFSCGGYFENASVYGGGWRDAYASRSGDYTVRVPAEKYDQFLSGTGGLGYVVSKSENSEDVGERYYDTEARLKTQRTKRDRLLALLERAESMEDIIALEGALSDVEYQIEQYSSELNRYDALINFSTFHIYLDEVGRVTQEVGETSSLGQRMSAGVQTSFRNLGEGFQNFLVWVSYNLFLTVVLLGVAITAVVIGKQKLKKYRVQSSSDDKQES